MDCINFGGSGFIEIHFARVENLIIFTKISGKEGLV